MNPRNFEMMPTSSALRAEWVCISAVSSGRQAVFLPEQRRELLVNLPDVVQQRRGVDLLHIPDLEPHLQAISRESWLTRREWPEVYGSRASMALTMTWSSS